MTLKYSTTLYPGFWVCESAYCEMQRLKRTKFRKTKTRLKIPNLWKHSEDVFELSSARSLQKRPFFHFPVCGSKFSNFIFHNKFARENQLLKYNYHCNIWINPWNSQKQNLLKESFKNFLRTCDDVFELSSPSWVQKRPLFHFSVCGLFCSDQKYFSGFGLTEIWKSGNYTLTLLKSGNYTLTLWKNPWNSQNKIFSIKVLRFFPELLMMFLNSAHRAESKNDLFRKSLMLDFFIQSKNFSVDLVWLKSENYTLTLWKSGFFRNLEKIKK